MDNTLILRSCAAPGFGRAPHTKPGHTLQGGPHSCRDLQTRVCPADTENESTMGETLSSAPAKTLWAVTRDGRDVILYPDGGWVFGRPGEGDSRPEPFAFRRTHWGCSPAEVQLSEHSELIKAGEGGLIYKSRISRFACLIAYFFARDKLVRAKYNLLVEHALANEYIADFEFLLGVLQKKYGTPVDSQRHWVDDRYRDDEESWGRAVLLGHLVLYEAWLTDSTEVSLMLRGEDQRVFLEIEYSSRALESLEDEASDSALLNQI